MKEAGLTQPESQQVQDIGEIMSVADSEQARRDQGFTDGRRGTFWTSDKSRYLYKKPCHRVSTIREAHQALTLLRHVTQLGVLYPATQWGQFIDKDGGVQLFAVTPRLAEPVASEQAPNPQRQSIKRIPPNLEGLFDEDSHILAWYRRLEPAFNPDTPPGSDSILWLLNPFEARHPDNWGLDDKGILFPVDVEVVDVSSSPAQLAIVHNWYVRQQTTLK